MSSEKEKAPGFPEALLAVSESELVRQRAVDRPRRPRVSVDVPAGSFLPRREQRCKIAAARYVFPLVVLRVGKVQHVQPQAERLPLQTDRGNEREVRGG